MPMLISDKSVFFFNDTATTEIYTLSLHDALPICIDTRWATIDAAEIRRHAAELAALAPDVILAQGASTVGPDRKSTRLNSSHANISYAVFCLKKKNTPINKRHYDIQLTDTTRSPH